MKERIQVERIKEEVIKLCGKQTVNQIKANEIALLLGIYQSLKDGDTIVEELMKPIRKSKEAKNNAIAAALKDAEISTGNGSNEMVDTETGEIKEPKKKKKNDEPEIFDNKQNE